jgi:aspartyl-tRNA synthetase
MFRTHTCGQLRAIDEGKDIELCGWVHRRRDHGGLIFIDLRDRYGLTQVVFDPKLCGESFSEAEALRGEFVIQVFGQVIKRPQAMINPKMATGEIEISVKEFKVLNKAKLTPFEIDSDQVVNEELRLKYRYLDIRRDKMRNNIVLRHRIIKFIRDFLDKQSFIEVETPMLIKGTPEGSREYIVPSRIYPGNFYVLPQSPQQLKQLLMVAGMDRYFQVARCFRDEDQRGDRQPEFTQLDMEMSFISQEDIIELNEKLMLALVKEVLPHKKILSEPFPRISWHEAMTIYGSDKPDLRFDLKLTDISAIVSDCGFQVFSNAAKDSGGIVLALNVPNCENFSRKDISELEEVAKIYEAKGLAYIINSKSEGLKSPIIKFLGEEKAQEIVNKTNSKPGDIIFFSADSFEIACTSLGQVRIACAKKLNLIDENLLAFCWVNDFPLFEWSAENNSITPSHHPFTSPKIEDIQLLETHPLKVRSNAYDLAMNGYEVAGGSIRIHDSKLQEKIFQLLKISPEEIKLRFGHMIEAFEYGAPPHGGIAWGLDRVIMLFADEPNIREVIAFPKDQKAKDLMLGAPSNLADEQVDEMHIMIKPTKK